MRSAQSTPLHASDRVDLISMQMLLRTSINTGKSSPEEDDGWKLSYAPLASITGISHFYESYVNIVNLVVDFFKSLKNSFTFRMIQFV